MNKRKILTLALSICMIAILAIGGSLAYLTDTDNQTNTFTVGDVKIDLWEDYTDMSKLVPGLVVEKEAYVDNIGSEPAYVRVHVAVPTPLADANLNAFNNMLHVNFTKASVAEGEWSWLPEEKLGQGTKYAGWIGNGEENYNVYKTTINNVEHVVFVITYTTPIGTGFEGTTKTPAINNVYLDQYVDAVKNDVTGDVVLTKPNYTDKQNGTVDTTNPELTYTFVAGKDTAVRIFAEAVQSEGFYEDGSADEAYAAFNASYPAIEDNYEIDWTNVEPEYKSFVNID